LGIPGWNDEDAITILCPGGYAPILQAAGIRGCDHDFALESTLLLFVVDFINCLGLHSIKMYTIFEGNFGRDFPRMAISEWLAFRLVGVALTK